MTGQGVDVPASISMHEYELEAVHEFAYLGSTLTDNLSLETELNRRIGKEGITAFVLKITFSVRCLHQARVS